MQKYISLLSGILACLLAGVLYSFNTYAVALKSIFNFTQTEVEYIASSGDVGQSFHLPAGILFDKYGSRVACIFGFILSVAGFTLLWMTTIFTRFFATKVWLVCAIFVIALFGTSFSFIAATGINCRNFERKHRGKVLGILECAYGIAPTIYSAIYQGLFVQGHIIDAENQKYGNFMLFLAAVSGFVNLLSIAFLKDVSQTDDKDETKLNETFKNLEKQMEGDKTSLIPKTSSNDIAEPQQDLTARQIIKTLEFYYLFMIAIIAGGTGATFVNNITLILKSAHRNNDIATFSICLPIFGLVGRIKSVAIFNHIFLKYPNIPKSVSLIPMNILNFISLILLIFCEHGFAVLFSSSLMMGIAYGAFYLQLKWVTVEIFGLKYFCQNLGTVLIAHLIGMFGCQFLYGFGYELKTSPGSRECYGESCSKESFALFAIMCFCGLLLNICLCKIEKDKTRLIQYGNNRH